MIEKDTLFRGIGVEVTFPQQEDFLKIKETLTRIGIASKKENKLFQSCHILHKQGRYVICHFKEMFILDGKQSDFSEEDKARRNRIVKLLEEWNLLKINHPELIANLPGSISQIKVISHSEKNKWVLEPKYNIGNKKISN